jgi:hypothetical protein
MPHIYKRLSQDSLSSLIPSSLLKKFNVSTSLPSALANPNDKNLAHLSLTNNSNFLISFDQSTIKFCQELLWYQNPIFIS